MKHNNWNRRDIIKMGSLFAFGASASAMAKPTKSLPISFPQDSRYKKPEKPITAVVLGAGNRGNVYAGYSKQFPDELKIVGVAEPIDYRRKRFAEKYEIPEQKQWVTWEQALEIPKFADALIITTPDNLHYGPAMSGLALNYDMILEKVIAQSWEQCNDIMKLAKRKDRMVAVCHVLRYTGYFRKLKEVMDSGVLGDVVSIQHLEPIGHIHMSHSFVRGNWRNSRESNPIILSKSCHDLDILRWLLGKPCKKVSSFGFLRWFKKENAPKGSTTRCTDGCAVEKDCPYSALKIYLKRKSYLGHLQLESHEDATILRELKNNQYGRCVYHCDNDVPDHQITNLEFEDRITVAFSMEAFTSYEGRRTRVMGTMGDVVGDMEKLWVNNFRTGELTEWDASQAFQFKSGHGGGDYGLVHDFVQAVSQHNADLLTSTIEASMESHLMGFQAEKSRLAGGKVMEVKLK